MQNTCGTLAIPCSTLDAKLTVNPYVSILNIQALRDLVMVIEARSVTL